MLRKWVEELGDFFLSSITTGLLGPEDTGEDRYLSEPFVRVGRNLHSCQTSISYQKTAWLLSLVRLCRRQGYIQVQ